MAIIVAHIIIQIQHPNLKGRYQHIATAISLGKGLTEVTVFGGFQDLRIQLRIVSNTAVLRFGELIFFSLYSYWRTRGYSRSVCIGNHMLLSAIRE